MLIRKRGSPHLVDSESLIQWLEDSASMAKINSLEEKLKNNYVGQLLWDGARIGYEDVKRKVIETIQGEK